MLLQTNQKDFTKSDLRTRLSFGADAELVRNNLDRIMQSSMMIEETKQLTRSQDRDPASIERKLYDAKARCKIKTAEYAMYLSDGMRSGFFSQLDDLLDPDNWEEDDDPISIESFTTLLRMLLFLHPSRRPGLGATQNGNIIAAWTNGRDRLTVECFPNNKVRWVLSRHIEDVRESSAGETPLIRLKEVLSPYSPEHWFLNESEKTAKHPA